MTTQHPIRVDFTPRFLRKLKQLGKKYAHSYDDVQTLIVRLEQGETPGDQVRGIEYPVYKARVRNTDVSKGKSGGYRVIYYLKMPTLIILVTIYSKTEQADITLEEIRRLIEEFNR